MAGNIRIIEPTENYQKVSKGIIFNRDIDALTLGIYVKVLCLGKEWELNIQGLAKALNLSEAKIKTAFSLLERAGYVKRIHIKDESNGRFLGFDYHIGAVPFPEEERTDLVATHGRNEPNTTKTQRMENPTAGKSNGWKSQPMENREDIYRDNIKDRDNIKKRDKKEFVPPTPKEVEDFAREKGFVDPIGFSKYFIEFYTESDWHLANGNKMKIWRQAVITWARDSKDRYFSRRQTTLPPTPSPAAELRGPRPRHDAHLDVDFSQFYKD